jgi:hypothetical protein
MPAGVVFEGLGPFSGLLAEAADTGLSNDSVMQTRTLLATRTDRERAADINRTRKGQ